MKQLKFFAMMMVAVLGMAFIGCTEGEDTPPQSKPLELQVVVDNVTKGSVTYSVTPSNPNANYLVTVVSKAFVDEIVEDEFIINNILDELKQVAASMGKTLDEYMPEVVDRGAVTEQVIKGLAFNTDYVLVAFGVDPTNHYVASSAVFRQEFTTAVVVMSQCTFEVIPSVLMNTVELKVTPSDPNIIWHLFVIEHASYTAYTDPAGEYKMSDPELYMAYMQNEVQQYLGAGYTVEEVMEALFLQGELTLQAKNMNANFEYGYMIAGLEIEDGTLYLITDTTYGTFTTADVAPSDMTFEISVDNVTMNRADILITPSNLEETFTWVVATYDGVSTEKELMDSWVAQNKMWFDWGMMLYTGVQDFTEDGPMYKYKVDAPDTDYYVQAFGYSGGVTTLPATKYFRTLPAPDPVDATFAITAQNLAPYSFTMNVDSSDDTSYYSIGITTDLSKLDTEALRADTEASLQDMLAMQQQINPSATMLQVLSTYFYRGDYAINASRLVPQTTYSAYVIVLNNDGTVANIFTYENVATTPNLGSINPKVELVGYYSGDEENGELFGQAEATAGKCIMVVKYSNFDGATALYAATLSGDYADAAAYPDGEVLYTLPLTYWTQINPAQPYSFYVAEWEVAQAACAFANDANGVMGIIGRLAVKPTAEAKGNYADLKALVTELNNQAAAPARVATPATVKKEKSVGEPVLTALTKKSVEEPVYNVPQAIERPVKAPIQKGGLRVVKFVSRVHTK